MRVFLLILTLATLGCSSSPFAGKSGADPVYYARAELSSTPGSKVKGFFQATEGFGKVKVYAMVEGLEPGLEHPIQIHRYGDCRGQRALKAGSVYSPTGPIQVGGEPKNLGELGVLKADKKGVAIFKNSFAELSLSGNKNPIVGRSIIIFESTAELTNDPKTRRLACGVIGAVEK